MSGLYQGLFKSVYISLVQPSTNNYSTIRVGKYTPVHTSTFEKYTYLVYPPLKTNESGIHLRKTVQGNQGILRVYKRLENPKNSVGLVQYVEINIMVTSQRFKQGE